MLLDLLFVFLFGITLWKIKIITPLNKFNDNYMSIKTCNSYRGFFALIVILHHISQRVTSGALAPDFTRIGYLAVSVFFFLSGYGLQKKNLSCENYSRGFLLKRIPAILIPYIIMTFLYWLTYALLGDVRSFSVVMDNFIKNGDPIVWFSWYVVCILVFYFVFFALMKLFGKNRLGMVLGGIAYYIIYVILCRALSFGLWWYSTALLLIVGILLASYEEKILRFSKKYYLVIFWACWVLFFILKTFKWTIYWSIPSVWTELTLIILLSTLFVSGVVLSSLKLRFGNNFLDFLGKTSFEIYMVQGLIMLLSKNNYFNIKNDFLWAGFVVVGSILSAFLLNKLFLLILKQYTKIIVKTR